MSGGNGRVETSLNRQELKHEPRSGHERFFMPTNHPVKPSAGKKKAAARAPEKATKQGRKRLENPKRGAERKRADARPLEGEDFYSSLFLNNHAVMLIIDP